MVPPLSLGYSTVSCKLGSQYFHPIVSISCCRKSFDHGWKMSIPVFKEELRAQATAPAPLRQLSHRQLLLDDAKKATAVLSFPTPAAAAKCARGKTGHSVASVPGGPDPEWRSGCKLEPQLPSAAPGCCARRCAPRAPLHGWAVSVRLAVLVRARTAAPSLSSWGDDFQFTWRLARLPRGSAS